MNFDNDASHLITEADETTTPTWTAATQDLADTEAAKEAATSRSEGSDPAGSEAPMDTEASDSWSALLDIMNAEKAEEASADQEISAAKSIEVIAEEAASAALAQAEDTETVVHQEMPGCACQGCSHGHDGEFRADNTAENGLGDQPFGTITDFAEFMYKDAFNYTWAPTFASDGVIEVSLNGNSLDANGIGAAHYYAAVESLKLIKALYGIDYEIKAAGQNGEINYTDDDGGAFAYLGGGQLNVSSDWNSWDRSLNSYFTQTFVHELGHSLGLYHTGFYNGTLDDSDVVFGNDSWQMSIMSYVNQGYNTFVDGQWAYTPTFGVADLVALDALLGAYGYTSANAFNGNTVYGFNTNITADQSEIYAYMADARAETQMTIADGSGKDTLDFSGWADDQNIDMRASQADSTAPSVSTVGARRSFIIAVGTTIENAITGDGDDTVQGNEVANEIRTNGGNDTVFGGAGNDKIYGGTGNNTLNGDAGNDIFFAEGAADFFDGGAGWDRADYRLATDGVTADLGDSSNNTGFADGDTYVSVERLFGTKYNDTLRGDDGKNTLWGWDGNDRLEGGGGNDALWGGDGNNDLFGGDGKDVFYAQGGQDAFDGGAGLDRVDYRKAKAAVIADLGDSSNNIGQAAGDTYVGVERLFGTKFNDTLRGDDGKNVLWGWNGDDRLEGKDGNDALWGGAGNNDLLGGNGNDVFYAQGDQDAFDGGAGWDRADYRKATAGLTADLGDTDNNTGLADGDTYVSVERLFGTKFDDTLRGDDGTNILWGWNGDDRLEGMGGNDQYFGGKGADTYVMGLDMGKDRIRDFNLEEDLVSFEGTGLSFADLIFSQVNSYALVKFDGSSDQLRFDNIDMNDLSTDHFAFV